jgi:L-ascorbate metabolism protein UlaG (beta-lactamase superfamily)
MHIIAENVYSSAIPIGAYMPEWFMRESHCTPAEAVKIHQAIRSKRSVAIHYDTFDLADEPRMNHQSYSCLR